MSGNADLPLTGASIVQMQRNGDNVRATTQDIADLTGLDGTEVVRVIRGKRWAKTTTADIAGGINGSDIVTIKQGKRHVRTTATSIAGLAGSGGGPAYEGPLDLVPGALAAYSPARALSSAMRGSTVAVVGGANAVADATTGAVSGGSVSGTSSELKDQSGNGNHVLQATGAKRPTWVTSAQNGKPGLLFVRADNQFLTTGSNVTVPAPGGLTVFVVILRNENQPADVLGIQADDGSEPSILVQVSEWDTGIWDFLASSNAPPKAMGGQWNYPEPSIGTCSIYDGKWIFGTKKAFKDGAELTLEIDYDADSDVGEISKPLNVGTAYVDKGFTSFDATLLELLIYPGVQSDADCLAIRQNLATYYGIAL